MHALARAQTHTHLRTHTHNTHARTHIHIYIIHTHTAFPSELHTAFPDKNDLHAMTVITAINIPLLLTGISATGSI